MDECGSGGECAPGGGEKIGVNGGVDGGKGFGYVGMGEVLDETEFVGFAGLGDDGNGGCLERPMSFSSCFWEKGPM